MVVIMDMELVEDGWALDWAGSDVEFCFRWLAGKVFVHCAMGLSRSATLVLAYLMIYENMTLVDAIKAVSANRNISPNNGFLEQLRELDVKLHCQGSSRSWSANGRTWAKNPSVDKFGLYCWVCSRYSSEDMNVKTCSYCLFFVDKFHFFCEEMKVT